MLGRPLLRTSYRQDMAMLPTMFQKVALGVLIVAVILLVLGNSVLSGFASGLLGSAWLRSITLILPIGIAALGFNLLVGVTGQVSLGHAFFMGVGAHAAVVLGGTGDSGATCVPFAENLGLVEKTSLCGFGMPIWIWLPAAGIVAALVGMLVAPAAVKVRGLYLAIVTVGLVFIGIHLSRMFPQYAGNAESGRKWPTLDLRLWKEETPLVAVSEDGKWFGLIYLTAEQKQFFVMFVLLILGTVLAKNIIRSRTGRAFQAIRDRDVAAEVMGVKEFKYKSTAFAVSSFYAGIGGALFASLNEQVPPYEWSLILSVEFIAILLIGGAGTIVGTIMGTVFVELMPTAIESFTKWLEDQLDGSGPLAWIANFILTDGQSGNFGIIATSSSAPGWPMTVFGWNIALYGVLIILFLIFEPLGMFGIWLRVKNYWKRWPFSY